MSLYIAAVGVFVTTGDLKDPLRQQIAHGMLNVERMPALLDGNRESINQSDLAFCLAPQDGAEIAG